MTEALTQLSADGLKYWSRCKKQFYYKHVLKLNWPSDIQHFSLGKDVHKLLDYQSRQLDCRRILEQASDAVKKTWEKLSPHPLVQLPVLANEWAFHVPVSLEKGYWEWLTGRIDRVARSGHELLVIDWKTGTGIPKKPEFDWQTRLYLFAVKEIASSPSATDLAFEMDGKPLTAEQIKFVYLEVKADRVTPIREVVLSYSEKKHEKTRQVLHSIICQMRQESRYALPDNLVCPDRFCVYRSICGIDDAGLAKKLCLSS